MVEVFKCRLVFNMAASNIFQKSISALNVIVISMAQEDYKEFICSRIGMECGFQVRAKTEAEIMEYAKMHADQGPRF